MISKNVLAKGQIVIPKTIRDLLGINVGDKMIVDPRPVSVKDLETPKAGGASEPKAKE